MSDNLSPSEEFWIKFFILISVISIGFILRDWYMPTKYTKRCGTVTEKILPQTVDISKSVATVNYNEYFVVKFDDNVYEKVNVSTDDYYKKEKGSTICFNNAEVKSGFYITLIVLAYLVLIIDILVLIVAGVLAINKYLDN